MMHGDALSISEPRPRPGTASGRIRRVVIVGGGVVGLCVARSLLEAGIEPVVIERDRVGSGASRGNAGQICAVTCAPLAAPGTIAATLRRLPRRDSAVYMHPQANPSLIRFLAGFGWHARPAPSTRGAHALGAFARDAVARYRDLQSQGVEMQLDETPYIYVHASRREAEAMRAQLQSGANDPAEAPGRVLEPDELRTLEPCLDGDRFGVRVERQAIVDPSVLVDSLAASLIAAGVEIREGARATAIRPTPRAVAIDTATGPVSGDAAVLAAGVWSAELARTIGVRLPIIAGKGYSFTVEFDEPPRHPVCLEAPHVVLTPLRSGTRVAGTMEFDRQHDRFDERRIEAIVAAARDHLRGAHWEERTHEWMGPRPMTPSGLPLIGRLGDGGRTFVAAGHNMYGLTLAPSTGAAIARLLTHGETGVDIGPFDPFGGGRRVFA